MPEETLEHARKRLASIKRTFQVIEYHEEATDTIKAIARTGIALIEGRVEPHNPRVPVTRVLSDEDMRELEYIEKRARLGFAWQGTPAWDELQQLNEEYGRG